MWDAIVSFFDGLAARYRARRAAQAQADLARGQAIVDAAAQEQREMDAAASAAQSPPRRQSTPRSSGPRCPRSRPPQRPR